jgi:hypothetical protein
MEKGRLMKNQFAIFAIPRLQALVQAGLLCKISTESSRLRRSILSGTTLVFLRSIQDGMNF